MKSFKYLSIILLLGFVVSLNAQTVSENFFNAARNKKSGGGGEGGMLSVSASYFTIASNGQSEGYFGGEIGYAYPVGEKLSIGLNGLFNFKSITDGGVSASATFITIQPEFRYYFGESALDGFYLAADADYHLLSVSVLGFSVSTSNFGAGGGLGYTAAFSDAIAGNFRAGAGYVFGEGGAFRWNVGAGIAFKF
jgi:Protein of unknown function (DUF3575)